MKSQFSKLMGNKINATEKIGNGRNSRVYRLTCEDSSPYALKFYYRHPFDKRDRLETEFSSMHFLWENGVRCIPRPIATYRDHGCAIYEYLNGKEILPNEITKSDIDDAVQFIVKLEEISTTENSRSLPKASEACFSVNDILKSIELRLNRFSVLPNEGASYDLLHTFLTNKFRPALNEIIQWSASRLIQSGKSLMSELPCEERTLSPSDFGFHNALRSRDGGIAFLDFEYFGWDDPAKMISDFLLHPAMKLGDSLKKRFTETTLNHFMHQRNLAKRIELAYPLFGLNWCLIILNEFVPEHLQRRGFAKEDPVKTVDLQNQQLEKCEKMLDRIINEYEHFPYSS